MLREIGSVVAVVNEDMVLLRLSEGIEADEPVVVFVRQFVTIEGASGEPASQEIMVPKGSVDIVMDEGNALYLAERFRGTVQRLKSLGQGLFGTVETVPGPWSAEIDDKGAAQRTSRKIRVGDSVGVEE